MMSTRSVVTAEPRRLRRRIPMLDAWQVLYTGTLILLIGATSTIDWLVTVSQYGRFVFAGGLLVVSIVATRGVLPIYRGWIHRWLLSGLWLVVLLAAASVVWSVDAMESALQCISLALLVGITHFASTRRWQDTGKLAADMGVAFGVLTAAFAAGFLALALGYEDAVPSSGRFQGIFDNPNMQAQLAALAVPLGWAVYRARARSRLWVVLILPSVLALLLTQTRAAILAVAVAVTWMIVRSGWTAVLKAAAIAVATASLALAATPALVAQVFARFSSDEGAAAVDYRVDGWRIVADIWSANPFGIGWKAGPVLFLELRETGRINFASVSAHNSLLQSVLDLGYLALVPFGMFAVAWVALAIMTPVAGLGNGLVGTTVAGIVVFGFESAIFGTGQAFPFVFWFAALGAASLSRALVGTPPPDTGLHHD